MVVRKLDIGVCSYRNPDKLRRCLESIAAMSTTDFHCLIVHNDSDDEESRRAEAVSLQWACFDNRFTVECDGRNVGYAGAVNRIARWAETPYFAYLDNDTEILTPGWDEKLCAVMDQDERIGQAFPGAGHLGFYNGQYHECLWYAGYAWVLRKTAVSPRVCKFSSTGPCAFPLMDTSLGHHEEVDLMIRLRLAGFRIACAPDVQIAHHETATSSPESAERIHKGVVRFMNKWTRYFCGEELKCGPGRIRGQARSRSTTTRAFPQIYRLAAVRTVLGAMDAGAVPWMECLAARGADECGADGCD